MTGKWKKKPFLTFPADFWIPTFFYNSYFNWSNMIDLRNLQEQIKKSFLFQKLAWPDLLLFEWIVLNFFAKAWPSASNFKSFFRSLKQFFLTVRRSEYFWKQNTIIFLLDSFYWTKISHIRKLCHSELSFPDWTYRALVGSKIQSMGSSPSM